MSSVYVNNITINAGVDFSQTFYLEGFIPDSSIDITGYNLSAQLRKWYGSLEYTEFECEIINPTNGTIRISLTSKQTKLLKPGRYVYDVILSTPFNFTTKIIEGMVLVREGSVISLPEEFFVKTSYTYSEIGIILEISPLGNSGGAPAPIITIDDIRDYGVVHLGVNFNQCSTFDVGTSSTRNLLEDPSKLQTIINYIELGGVIWLNVEWWNNSPSERACSDKNNINAMLTLLKSEIRATGDQGFVGNSNRSTNTTVVNSGFPEFQSQNASVLFTGGVPVYVIEGGSKIITTYEKIGNGILYVSGDSNTFSGPSYPPVYYDALRALVLNV